MVELKSKQKDDEKNNILINACFRNDELRPKW